MSARRKAAISPLRAPVSTSNVSRAESRRLRLALTSIASIWSSPGVRWACFGVLIVMPDSGFLTISSSLTNQP